MKKSGLTTLLVSGVLTILLVSGLVLVLCISKEGSKETTESSEVKTEQVDRETAKKAARKEKEQEIKLGTLIPDDEKYFPGKEVEIIDGEDGDNYGFDIKGATEEEYKTFIEACKGDEWFNVDAEANDYFYSYSFDKAYYLTVTYNAADEYTPESYVNVWVSKSKNAEMKAEVNVEINTGK